MYSRREFVKSLTAGDAVALAVNPLRALGAEGMNKITAFVHHCR